MTNHLARDLYALYASKNRLCTLCEDTTPEKTAYNAYKKTVWLRSRAESTKMYALKDAYRMHTSAYKHIKRVKERFFLLLLLYVVCFLFSTARVYRQSNFSLPASSGIPRRTMNDF